MKDQKVIYITPLLRKEFKGTSPQNFRGSLYLKFSQDSATFTVHVENAKGDVALTSTVMEEVIYRMFEVIEALQEEFQIDL